MDHVTLNVSDKAKSFVEKHGGSRKATYSRLNTSEIVSGVLEAMADYTAEHQHVLSPTKFLASIRRVLEVEDVAPLGEIARVGWEEQHLAEIRAEYRKYRMDGHVFIHPIQADLEWLDSRLRGIDVNPPSFLHKMRAELAREPENSDDDDGETLPVSYPTTGPLVEGLPPNQGSLSWTDPTVSTIQCR